MPREANGFEAVIIHYPVRYNHDGDDAATGSAFVTTPAPTTTTCGDATDEPSNLDGGSNPWTRVTATLGTSLDGITVTHATAIGIPANDAHNLSVRLCVRATRNSADTAGVNGPWRIGGATTITKQAPF